MRGIIIGCLTALGQNHVWGGRLEGSIEFPRESFIVLTGCQWGLQQCGKGHLTLAVSRRVEKPRGPVTKEVCPVSHWVLCSLCD